MPQLHFSLTMGDFARAQPAIPRKGWQAVAYKFTWVPIAVTAEVIFLWIQARTGSESFLLFWFSIFGTFVVSNICVNQWRWRHAKQFHGPQTVDVTETGLRFVTKQEAQWLAWTGIMKFARAGKVFVLTTVTQDYRIIPESAFLTPEAANAFEQLLKDRTSPTIGFAVLPAAQEIAPAENAAR
jgi:hypothetical protein